MTFYSRYLVAGTADYREPLPTAWAFRYQLNTELGINTWVRAYKASVFNRTVFDLASARVTPYTYGFYNWGNIVSPGPATLYASACVPYTYWAWDEDENVNTVTSDEDPWSGGPASPIRPVPNLLPLETQEVGVDQFFLVGQSDGDAFGWLLFAWPGTNQALDPRIEEDWYQTWMAVKYAGFGDYSAALTAAVMANFNCDSNEVLPVLNLGRYSFNPPQGPPNPGNEVRAGLGSVMRSSLPFVRGSRSAVTRKGRERNSEKCGSRAKPPPRPPKSSAVRTPQRLVPFRSAATSIRNPSK